MLRFLFGSNPEFRFESRLFLAGALPGGLGAGTLAGLDFLAGRADLACTSAALALLLFFSYAIGRKRYLPALAWTVALLTLAMACLYSYDRTQTAPGSLFLCLLSLSLVPVRGRWVLAGLAFFGSFIATWLASPIGLWPATPALIERLQSAIVPLFILALFSLVLYSASEMVRRLENYRAFFEEDLTLARMLQKQVLETPPEVTNGYHFELLHRPSGDLSGDVYDLSRPRPDLLRIFLADARGHGINASLSGMLIKSEWLNLNLPDSSPGQILDRLNQRIIQRYGEIISLSAIIVDIHPEHLLYAAGGHLPQFLLTQDTVIELESHGPPPGMLVDAIYQEQRIPISTDSRLVLFTDGLIEDDKEQSAEAGLAWLKQVLHSCSHLSVDATARAILAALALNRKQDPEHLVLSDDLTLIIVQGKS